MHSMKVRHYAQHFAGVTLLLALAILTAGRAFGQTCFTSDDMDPATRSALQSAATRYADMVISGNTAALQQNSIPALASSFAGIESTIKDDQANLKGAQVTMHPPFLLKAEGTAPLPKAEFLCGVFDAMGQTKNSAEFVIPNLPPGTYGIAMMDLSGGKASYTLAFVLQQQGNDWKIGGLYLRNSQIAGHDSNWFLDQARAFKAKGQTHNAWLYFLEGRDLAMPVPFMYTQQTDKLYQEAESLKPTDFPEDGKTIDLSAPDGKTYKAIAIFPVAVGQDLDIVVRYQVASIADTGQTFQSNISVMKALLAKFPELRDAFAGVVARAVQPDGKDYGSLMPMKEIK